MKISRIQVIGNLLGLIPGLYIAFQAITGNLSANPVQTATIITGRTSIYALLFSLYCSPLARLLKLSVFHRMRKIAGLFGFYYAFFHFVVFAVFDYRLNFSWILPEIKQKPFLQIGLLGLVLLFPLALTSLNSLKKGLGVWWKKLHTIVYGITAIVLLHAALASKGDIIDPAILISIFLLAMIMRLPALRSLQIKSVPGWLGKINTFLIE